MRLPEWQVCYYFQGSLPRPPNIVTSMASYFAQSPWICKLTLLVTHWLPYFCMVTEVCRSLIFSTFLPAKIIAKSFRRYVMYGSLRCLINLNTVKSWSINSRSCRAITTRDIHIKSAIQYQQVSVLQLRLTRGPNSGCQLLKYSALNVRLDYIVGLRLVCSSCLLWSSC